MAPCVLRVLRLVTPAFAEWLTPRQKGTHAKGELQTPNDRIKLGSTKLTSPSHLTPGPLISRFLALIHSHFERMAAASRGLSHGRRVVVDVVSDTI